MMFHIINDMVWLDPEDDADAGADDSDKTKLYNLIYDEGSIEKKVPLYIKITINNKESINFNRSSKIYLIRPGLPDTAMNKLALGKIINLSCLSCMHCVRIL